MRWNKVKMEKFYLTQLVELFRKRKVQLCVLFLLMLVVSLFLVGNLFAADSFDGSNIDEENDQTSITILLPQHMLPRESFMLIDQ